MLSERAKMVTYIMFVVIASIVIIADTSAGQTWRMLAIGALGSLAAVAVIHLAARTHRMQLFLLGRLRYRNELIRISAAYLVRIELNGSYVLIWSDRFEHYQPVGGVYKCIPSTSRVLERFGVQHDNQLPIDDDTREDLRIRIPGKHLMGFLAWFESAQSREIGAWREFHDELIRSGILPAELFEVVFFRWVRRHMTPIQRSQHFDCQELKIADIFEAVLSEEQEKVLRDALLKDPERLRSAKADEIRRRGVAPGQQPASIAETAEWLLPT